MSVPKGKSTRHSCRKGDAQPHHRPRRTPALSTQEADARVMRLIEARRPGGRPLDQIGGQRYCRDRAVAQAVTPQLEPHTDIQKEVSP
jgi:hypothetical protein